MRWGWRWSPKASFTRPIRAATGTLPIPVTLCLEGEEESGSTNLAAFLAANKDELAADVALVCDTDMLDAQTPAVTTMLRGLVGEEIVIDGSIRVTVVAHGLFNLNTILVVLSGLTQQP